MNKECATTTGGRPSHATGYERAQLKARVPQKLRERIDAYLLKHRREGLTQNQLVATAIRDYIGSPRIDEVLYDRLDRIAHYQEEINMHVDMLGRLFSEYLFYWFRQASKLDPARRKEIKEKSRNSLDKFLSSLLNNLGRSDLPDLLDPANLTEYLRRQSPT